MQSNYYPIPKYFEKHGISMGRLIIKDLPLASSARRNPLAEIWESVEKTIIEKYDISVKAHFEYGKDAIICWFNRNDKYAQKNNISQRLYEMRFKETFARQMLLFEEAIERFILDDENGYRAYCSQLA